MEHVSIVGVPITSSRPTSRSHGRTVTPGQRSRSRSPGGLKSRSPSQNPLVNNHVQYTPSTNGSLLAPPTIVVVNDEPRQPFDLGDLTAYKSSPDVTRYFCRSCAAHLFWVHHGAATTVTGEGEHTTADKWAVAVGALTETEDIVKVGFHIWVGDTLDGGLADHLTKIDGVELPRYKEGEGSEQVPIRRKDLGEAVTKAKAPNGHSLHGQGGAASNEQLGGYCHCGTISYAITRPNEQSFLPTAAYPDLIYPHDATRLSKVNNPNDEKWWLCPRTPAHNGSSSDSSASSSSASSDIVDESKTKYLAGHCMCTYCRLTSGFEVQSWAFVPLANIVAPAGSDVPLYLALNEARPKGLKQYISSPGRYREFCGTCGATVCWWQAGVPGLVNVSVGLLDEKVGGARAEQWLEWHKDRVSFEGEALSPKLAEGLHDGLIAS